MKKLAILLLTVFTISTAVVCGCGGTKGNGNKVVEQDVESVQLQQIDAEQNDEIEEEKPDEHKKPECPDCKKRDGECPAPCKPHKRPDKKMPRPKHAYNR